MSGLSIRRDRRKYIIANQNATQFSLKEIQRFVGLGPSVHALALGRRRRESRHLKCHCHVALLPLSSTAVRWPGPFGRAHMSANTLGGPHPSVRNFSSEKTLGGCGLHIGLIWPGCIDACRARSQKELSKDKDNKYLALRSYN